MTTKVIFSFILFALFQITFGKIMSAQIPHQTISLSPQEQQTIDYYDTHGQTWSNQHEEASFWEKEFATFRRYLSSGTILEVGFGNGRDAHLFIQNNYHYTGIDPSNKFLEIARTANPGVSFLSANLYQLPFEDATFDGFWAAAVFLHVPKNRINEALSSLKRVLKPGALGFISLKEGEGESVEDVTGRFFAYYNSEEFKNILRQNNFTILEHTQRTDVKRIKPYTWLSFFVRCDF